MSTQRSSLLDDLMGTMNETDVATKAAETAIEEAGVQIDGDIADNPVYQALNSDLTDSEIIEKIGELVARDPDATKEENLAKIGQFVGVNRHFQDQIVNLAHRLSDFSNHDALSLYDEALEKLKGHLKGFSTKIAPVNQALKIIEQAEAEGRDPEALIEEVQALHAKQKELRETLIAAGYDPSDPKLGDSIKGEITTLQRNKENAQRDVDTSKADLTALEKKFLVWKKDSKLSDARWKVNQKERSVTSYEGDIESKSSILESAIALSELDQKVDTDASIGAISTLLQITGQGYEGERSSLVDNAKTFIDEATTELDQCISRFVSLENEIQDFSSVADNVVNQYFLMIKGADEAYKSTETMLASDTTERDELTAAEEEQGLTIPSPEAAKLSSAVAQGKDFLNQFLPNSDSAIKFRSILAQRQGEFTALSGLIQGKRIDAEELRTNGAVSVASQLVMTLKTLEAAIAGHKTDVIRGMLKTFSDAARETTDEVFNGLISEQGDRNSRLIDTLQDMVKMKATLDEATDEMLAKRRDEAGLTEAVVEATDRVSKAADDLKNTVADGRRQGKEAVADGQAEKIVDGLEKKIGGGGGSFGKAAEGEDPTKTSISDGMSHFTNDNFGARRSLRVLGL